MKRNDNKPEVVSWPRQMSLSTDRGVTRLTSNQESDHIIDDILMWHAFTRFWIMSVKHCIDKILLILRMSSSLLDDVIGNGPHQLDAVPVFFCRLAVYVIGHKFWSCSPESRFLEKVLHSRHKGVKVVPVKGIESRVHCTSTEVSTGE